MSDKNDKQINVKIIKNCKNNELNKNYEIMLASLYCKIFLFF